ncbi:MAG: Mut7-C RNAse domain-containing protein [Bacteroidales bacterium]|nr:Mut7-C RNAse domain-containing protein [Bacteroidales bacterium]
MQRKATFQFMYELNDFLQKKNRNQSITYVYKEAPSIKDAIEAIGIPHPEVAIILANNQSVSFDYKINNLDEIKVFPYYHKMDIQDIVSIKPLGKARFILDVHLGGLARYLRMAGFDVLYNNEDWGDKYIADRGGKEKRIVLTRDVGLLKRSSVVFGYYLRKKDSYEQFKEVTERYRLNAHFDPFTRCIRCNGAIEKVSKTEIIDKLEPGTIEEYNEFWQCIGCKQIYWKGSHYNRMLELMK